MRAFIIPSLLFFSLSTFLLMPKAVAADSDGDGVEDEYDLCPDVAEDADAFEDSDGCPDYDNDGDGIPDIDDACPNESGSASNGCPETLAPTAAASQSSSGVPVEDFARAFLEMLQSKDLEEFKNLAPTDAELEAFYRDGLPEDIVAANPGADNNPDSIRSYLLDYDFSKFDETIWHLESVFPLIPLSEFSYVSSSARPMTERSDLIGYTSHTIDITVSVFLSEIGELQFVFSPRVLKASDRYALVQLDAEGLVREIPSAKSDRFIEEIVEIMVSSDTARFQSEMLPTLEDVLWQLRHRASEEVREECLDNPADCDLTEESFHYAIEDFFDTEFEYLLEEFDYYKKDDRIVGHRVTDYELVTEEIFVYATHAFLANFEVDYAREGTHGYQLIVGAMLCPDKLKFGGVATEVVSHEVIEEEERELEEWRANQELQAGNENKKPAKLSAKFYGYNNEMKGEDCPRAASKAVSSIAVYESGDLSEFLEYSDVVIDCPYGAKIKTLIRMYEARGEAYYKLYSLLTTENLRERDKYLTPRRLYLPMAVDAYCEAYKLEETFGSVATNYELEQRQSYLYGLVSSSYLAADSLRNEEMVEESISYFAAAADGSELIEMEDEALGTIRAFSGYYAGTNALDQGQYEDAARYLRLAVAFDVGLTTSSREEIEAELFFTADNSAGMYYNLGTAYYNRASELINQTLDLSGEPLSELKSLANNAETAFKLGLILNPEDADAKNALAAVDQLQQMLASY